MPEPVLVLLLNLVGRGAGARPLLGLEQAELWLELVCARGRLGGGSALG